MANRARIYRQSKSASQSGMAGTDDWVLDFEPSDQRRPDSLMGWVGSRDTQAQVRLRFDTVEEARAYAENAGLVAEVELPHDRKFKPKAYADNFRFGRTDNWTH